MELEQLAYLQRQALERARACLPDLKAQLVDVFAPRPRPRPEVLGGVQMLATAVGLPVGCPNPDCRRAGLCRAKDPAEPDCADLWPEQLTERMDYVLLGIALSAVCVERHDEVIHARIKKLIETPEAATANRKKRPA